MLIFIVLAILAIVPLILIFLVQIPWLIHAVVKDSFDYNKYEDYLKTIEGTKFFCYNSKTNRHRYVKKHILHLLPSDVKIIYINGRRPITEYDSKYIKKALESIKDKKGYPYLLKIRNGKLLNKSMNEVFYNTLHEKESIETLIEQINYFYDSP